MAVTSNNSYAGPTNVNQGTLLVNNGTGSGTGSGAVNVNNGGILGGTGSINGPVTIKNGATLNPGPAGLAANTGLLTVNNDITFESGSMFWVDVNTTADYDQLRVTGTNKTVEIQSGALLGGTAGPGLTASASFTILDNRTVKGDLPNRISGTFTSLGVPLPQSPPRTVNLGGELFDTSLGTSRDGDFYNGGNGNDLVLHPAPPVFIWDGKQDGSPNPTGDSLWTNRFNWVGDVAPAAGDKVVFDDTGISTNDHPINDFPDGTSFGEIRLANTGGSYTIAGNEILFASATGALIQDNPTQVSVTNHLNFAFATSTSAQVIIVEAGTLNFGGTVALGSSLTIVDSDTGQVGNVTFNETVTGAGQTIVANMQGDLTFTDVLTADQLGVLNAGTVTATAANHLNTFAASTSGSISLYNAADLVIDTVTLDAESVSGITSSGGT